MRRLVLSCCLLLLTACESPLQKLHALNPSTDDFNGSLASEYLAYADSESEQGRKLVAEHYADKGLKTMQGEKVEPNPVDTSLPPQDQKQLTAARGQLMGLLTDAMKQEAPQELARAQLLFDCWQHEIKRRINQELAPCEDDFYSTISDLQNISDSLSYTQETDHTLTFARNSVVLTAKDNGIIRDIGKQVKHYAGYAVAITAPDTKDEHKRTLANQRVANVHKALIKMGVDEKYIRVKRVTDDKKVYLGHETSPANAVMVTVKTPED